MRPKILLALLVLTCSCAAQTFAPFQNPHQQYLDENGKPLAGGRLSTYAAGTLTLLTTYQDAAGTVPNTNPVVLDSGGFATIYMNTSLLYKVVAQDSSGVQQWVVDNVSGGGAGGGGGGGGGGGTGTVTNNGTLVNGQPVYGNGTTVIQTAPTELAVDTFAGSDFGTKANNAIGALPSTGGTIRFSCTNYAASSTTITISVNNVTLQGCGSQNASVFATGGTTLNFAAGVSGIVSTGANTQIRDLMVASADTGTGSDNGISLGQQKPILWNVGVRKFGGVGIIYNNNTDRWNMTNVESSGNYGDGYRFTAVSDDNLGIGQNLSAVSNGGIGFDILGGGANVFQETHAANNTGGAWFVHAFANYFLNTYIETGTGSSFIFDTGVNQNTVGFATFGYPTTYTDGGTNVKTVNGLNTALSLARSITATTVTGTDTVALTTTPTFAKQTQPGLEINFVPLGSNTTTSVTAAVNGMTALPVQKSTPTGLVNLAVGDLVSSTVASLSLDPTASYWVLGNPATSSFVGGVPGALGDLLFSSGTNTLFVDSGNAYYDLPNKVFYVPSMRLNSATDGYVSYVAGTGTLPALAANSTGFSAPPSGGTSGLIKLPSTLTAGALTLAAPTTVNGVNQSQASITPTTSTAAPSSIVKTNSAGVIDPSFFINPSLFKIEDNFCFGIVGNSGSIGLGWIATNLGSAPAFGFLSSVYPYPCGVSFKSASAATAGQGGYITMGGGAGPAGVNGQLPDLAANAGWSSTWVFKTPSITNTEIVIGLVTSISSNSHGNGNGMFLRYDPLSPYSSTANSSISCTTTTCTIVTPASTPMTSMSVTISGATCATRSSINGTYTTISSNGTTNFTIASTGTAEASCPTPGTTTSTAETTYKVCNHGSSAMSCIDTGVTADTNVHKIVMASPTPGTMVYTLDANAPITIASGMPTTSTYATTVWLTTMATAQVEVDLEYFNFIWPGLPR